MRETSSAIKTTFVYYTLTHDEGTWDVLSAQCLQQSQRWYAVYFFFFFSSRRSSQMGICKDKCVYKCVYICLSRGFRVALTPNSQSINIIYLSHDKSQYSSKIQQDRLPACNEQKAGCTLYRLGIITHASVNTWRRALKISFNYHYV